MASSSLKYSEESLTAYTKKQGIRELMEDLVVAILADRPDNVPEYSIKWLRQRKQTVKPKANPRHQDSKMQLIRMAHDVRSEMLKKEQPKEVVGMEDRAVLEELRNQGTQKLFTSGEVPHEDEGPLAILLEPAPIELDD
eukprot:c46074_g1_i1.p1 GENE.c46074_g1_i1~~c46074_g1_i1.p1  ORF type:complete len:139 (+),score=32.02 c46074_g1_i1:57-473(+)